MICNICHARVDENARPEHYCPPKSLRDEFAMAALMGVVAFETGFGANPSNLEINALTGDSYRIADKMLEARKLEKP